VADTADIDLGSTWSDEAYCGFVTVGERGQVVIPAALRRDCEINPGDRLLAVRAPVGGGVVLAKMEVLRQLLAHLGLPGPVVTAPDEGSPEGGGAR
jgi:AbrB family looped-hinge helix DNA binding protein